jgi:hypothetical protein
MKSLFALQVRGILRGFRAIIPPSLQQNKQKQKHKQITGGWHRVCSFKLCGTFVLRDVMESQWKVRCYIHIGVIAMNYFELTENISKTDETLRILSGAALLLVTPTAIAVGSPPGLLPMIAFYLVLTGIMKWDPVGYVIEIVLRILEPVFTHSDPAQKT